jgi:hypothetical protein
MFHRQFSVGDGAPECLWRSGAGAAMQLEFSSAA